MNRITTCRWVGCFKTLPLGANSHKNPYCTYHRQLRLGGKGKTEPTTCRINGKSD